MQAVLEEAVATNVTSAAGQRVECLPVGRIDPGNNDRVTFRDAPLEELAASIAQHGLAQPITVRPKAGGRYEIIAGERRWRATQIAGLATINAIVREDLDDETASAIMLIENVNRADLDPIEEATAYAARRDRFGWTVREIAQKVGKADAIVDRRLRLLDLAPEIQGLVKSGDLRLVYAEQMTRLDRARQHIALRALREAKYMSFSAFRQIVSDLLEAQAQESFVDFMTITAVATSPAESGKKDWWRDVVPHNEDGVKPVAKRSMTYGQIFDQYMTDLLAAGLTSEAEAVGNLFVALAEIGMIRLPLQPRVAGAPRGEIRAEA